MIEIRKTPHADTRSCDVTTAVKETVQLETFYHIQDVGKLLNFFSNKLQQAAQEHDADKLSKFDWFWANFQTNFKERDWLENHYRINRHHLNAEGGVPADVNLLDVLEFMADCITAGIARHGYVTELLLSPELLMTAAQNTIKLGISQLRLVPEYRPVNSDVHTTVQTPSKTFTEVVGIVEAVAPGPTTTIAATTYEDVDVLGPGTVPVANVHDLFDVEKETASMLREQAKQALLNEPNPMYAEEVASLLDCDKSTVHAYGRKGLILCARCGKRTRYCRKSVQALVDGGFVVPNLGLRAKVVRRKVGAKTGKPVVEPLADGTLVFAARDRDAKMPRDYRVGFICGYSNEKSYIVSNYKNSSDKSFYKMVEPLQVEEADKLYSRLQSDFDGCRTIYDWLRLVRPNRPSTPQMFPDIPADNVQ